MIPTSGKSGFENFREVTGGIRKKSESIEDPVTRGMTESWRHGEKIKVMELWSIGLN